LSETNLRLCRQFYTVYPHLISAIKSSLEGTGLQLNVIHQSVTDELKPIDFQSFEIGQSSTDQLETDELGKNQDAHFENDDKQLMAPEKILSKLSYTHIVLLLPIEDIAKRSFYELECIRQAWSVSELKRQINTLY